MLEKLTFKIGKNKLYYFDVSTMAKFVLPKFFVSSSISKK